MKYNPFYILWVLLFICAGFLVRSFLQTSQRSIFGSADTEGQVINFEHAVIVKKILVRSGSPIKKGDTLMLLQRPELNRESSLKQEDINLSDAVSQVRSGEIDRDIESLRSNFLLKKNEYQTQIKLLESEVKAKRELLNVINTDKNDNGKEGDNSLLIERIDALKNAIKEEEKRYKAQLRTLKKAKENEHTVLENKMNASNQELTFIEEDKGKLILRSPIDGFVQTIFVFENQITPQFSPMMRVNPLKPNRIKGFIPESVSIEYSLGDTVEVQSVRRSSIKSKGILIGSSPQLIELPNRLRKMQTISSWGRELFVTLPEDNEFFIGEKTMVRLKEK